jgi:putative transposase
LRYIHNNPVKADLVDKAEDYTWSSYRDYLSGKGIIDSQFALNLFSQSGEKAVQLFQDYHQKSNDDLCLDVELIDKLTDSEALNIIREVFRIDDISELDSIDKKSKREALRKLKNNYRLSYRQIERLTAINRGTIERA